MEPLIGKDVFLTSLALFNSVVYFFYWSTHKKCLGHKQYIGTCIYKLYICSSVLMYYRHYITIYTKVKILNELCHQSV